MPNTLHSPFSEKELKCAIKAADATGKTLRVVCKNGEREFIFEPKTMAQFDILRDIDTVNFEK